MDRAQAIPYISYIVDDSLNATTDKERPIKDDAILVGWQCGFEPMFVAVQSYMDGVKIDEDEAYEIAMDYLVEIDWFPNDIATIPDYIIH